MVPRIAIVALVAISFACGSTGGTDGGSGGGGSATGGGAATGGGTATGGGSGTGGGSAMCGTLALAANSADPCFAGCTECNVPTLVEGNFALRADSTYLSSSCGLLTGRIFGALHLSGGTYEEAHVELTGSTVSLSGDPLLIHTLGTYTTNGQMLHVNVQCSTTTLLDGGPASSGTGGGGGGSGFDVYFGSSPDGGELVLGGSGSGGGIGAGTGGKLYGKE